MEKSIDSKKIDLSSSVSGTGGMVVKDIESRPNEISPKNVQNSRFTSKAQLPPASGTARPLVESQSSDSMRYPTKGADFRSNQSNISSSSSKINHSRMGGGSSLPSGPYSRDSSNQVHLLEPEVIEKKNWAYRYGRFAIIIAVVLIAVFMIVAIQMDISTTTLWIVAFILVTLFAVLIYFLIEPKVEKEVRQKVIETRVRNVEVPVVKEIPVVKEVIKEVPVIKTVEVEKAHQKEIQKEIIREVPVVKNIRQIDEVHIYKKPAAVYNADYDLDSLKAPKKESISYDFVGSNQTKVYHRSNCRIGKSIELKHKVRGTTASFFKNQGYRRCKLCLE